MGFIKTLYPLAGNKKVPTNDPAIKKARRAFIKASGSNFLFLQILFLALFCYIFGSLFQQQEHTHNLRIAFVDYDGGAIAMLSGEPTPPSKATASPPSSSCLHQNSKPRPT